MKEAILPPDTLLFPALKAILDPKAVLSELDRMRLALLGNTVVSTSRHGKYFWLRFGGGVALLMHLGMTGMVRLKGVHSRLVMMENGGDKIVKEMIKREVGGDPDSEVKGMTALKSKVNESVVSSNSTVKSEKEIYSKKEVALESEANCSEVELERGVNLPREDESEMKMESIRSEASLEIETNHGENGDPSTSNRYSITQNVDEWPPRFTKFELKFLSSTGQCLQMAFTDPRRLARVRVVHGIHSDNDLYVQSPLAELGPDYSKLKHPPTHLPLSVDAFGDFLKTRMAPIKSLLLNQALFAGVGNWVLDEILFHAKVHPGQVVAKWRDDPDFAAVCCNLYNALVHVCLESVRLEGDSSRFPHDWLMLHRWGKRRHRDETQMLPDGRELAFVTVGGRTSCFVPRLQVIGRIREGEPNRKRRRDTVCDNDGGQADDSGLGDVSAPREKTGLDTKKQPRPAELSPMRKLRSSRARL